MKVSELIAILQVAKPDAEIRITQPRHWVKKQVETRPTIEGVEYTEGVCEDGAAILKDGQRMTVSEVLSELNSRPAKPSEDGWRGIESAPRDGKMLLSFIDGETKFIFWRDNMAYPKLSGFRDVYDHLRVRPFTHWQPLPPPPT